MIDAQRQLVETVLRANYAEAEKGGHVWPWEWSLQGLGMLRAYLNSDKSLRLHVWDSRFATDASPMHTHPWDMESQVIEGELYNIRWGHVRARDGFENFWQQKIFCGQGGGLEGEPRKVDLFQYVKEHYKSGESYRQSSSEIHVSEPADGTVTLVKRTFGEDVDHAYVYWPVGEEWKTAEPRPATSEEVYEILGNSLDNWFGGR